MNSTAEGRFVEKYERLNQLLQSQQRFMEVGDYQVGVGDEQTLPGTQAGFQLDNHQLP